MRWRALIPPVGQRVSPDIKDAKIGRSEAKKSGSEKKKWNIHSDLLPFLLNFDFA